MTRDAGTASFTKPHAVRQQFVDEEAPFLLRPPGDDPEDKRNWVVKAIERTGQSVDEALHTWIYGFTLEPSCSWTATVESRATRRPAPSAPRSGDASRRSIKEAAASLLTDHIGGATVRPRARDRARRVLARTRQRPRRTPRPLEPRFTGTRPPDVAVLEHLYGAREGLIMYSRVWESSRSPFSTWSRATSVSGDPDDRGPREAEPSLLGGDRERGRRRRDRRPTATSRSSRHARSATTWSTCTGRTRPAG